MTTVQGEWFKKKIDENIFLLGIDTWDSSTEKTTIEIFSVDKKTGMPIRRHLKSVIFDPMGDEDIKARYTDKFNTIFARLKKSKVKKRKKK